MFKEEKQKIVNIDSKKASLMSFDSGHASRSRDYSRSNRSRSKSRSRIDESTLSAKRNLEPMVVALDIDESSVLNQLCYPQLKPKNNAFLKDIKKVKSKVSSFKTNK